MWLVQNCQWRDTSVTQPQFKVRSYYVGAQQLATIHRDRGGQWRIFTKLRGGDVNTHLLPPVPRWIFVFVYTLILWDKMIQKDDFELFIPATISTFLGANPVEVNGEGCAKLRFSDYFWVLYIRFEWVVICQIFWEIQITTYFNFVCKNFKTLSKR